MLDKKLTDAEIVKALEDWIKNYDGSYVNFKTLGNTLDLINRLQANLDDKEETIQYADKVIKSLQADIDRLQAENKRLSTLAELGNKRANDYRVMRDRALKAEAENEGLKEEICIQHKIVDERGKEVLRHDRCIRTLHEKLKTAKAEAYKECIERVYKFICDTQNWGALHREFLENGECYWLKQKLNNLLKELVGEDK